jgi:hypothetical protein
VSSSNLQDADARQFFSIDKRSSSSSSKSHAAQRSIEMVETATAVAATTDEEQGEAVLLSARHTRRRPAAAKRSNLMQMLSVPLARNVLGMYMVVSLLVSNSACIHNSIYHMYYQTLVESLL